MSNGIKKNLKFKVGFAVNFSSQKWLGGYNIIINLIEAILQNKNSKIEPILILENNSGIKINFENKKLKIIKTDIFSSSSLIRRVFEKLTILFFGKSKKYENYLSKENIYALSHTLFPLGSKSSIKSFPWIPDYQYIYYPKNFSFKNRLMKNLNTFFCAYCSSKIILSSRDVKKDIKIISDRAYKNSCVNSFVFNVPKKNKIKKLSFIKEKYNIPKKYFYVPNQYWIHKNHTLILKSLKKILKYNKDICVVSTGYKDDHRQGGYFEEIQNFIKENNLKKNYRYLGTINYLEVMSLMYHSVAVINPSKFEGWSSSVEQAKSMGKIVLLSDINVHREQNPDRSVFFDISDSEKLKNIMIKTWKNHNLKREKFHTNFAYKNLENRLIKYSKEFEKILINA